MKVTMAVVGPGYTGDPEAQIGRRIRLTAGRTGARVEITGARRANGWLEVEVEVPPALEHLFER